MEGSWIKDFPEKCEYVSSNGIRYVGWWISIDSGNGEILFPNGDRYQGYWHKFLPHK